MVYAADKTDVAKKLFSLEDCVARALEFDPQVLLGQGEVDAAKVLEDRAQRSKILPKIDLVNMSSLGPGVNLGPSGFVDDATENDWSHLGFTNRVQISAVQPLFTFGKIESAVKAAAAFVQLKKKNLEQKRLETVFNVSTLYHTRVFIKELKRIIETGHSSLQKAIDHSQKLLRSKKKTKIKESDLIQLQIFKLILSNKEHDLDILNEKTLLTLKKLMNIDDSIAIDTEDNFLDPLDKNVQSKTYYLSKLNGDHLFLGQMDQALQAKKAQLQIARADYYPQFFMAGQFSYAMTPHREDSHNPYLNDPLNEQSGALVIGLKMPLSFHLTSLGVQERKVEVSNLEIQKSLLQKSLAIKVDALYGKLIAGQSQMENSEQQRVLAKKWFNSELITFDLGETNGEDLLKSLKAYLESSALYQEAILNFNKSFYELDFVVGERIGS